MKVFGRFSEKLFGEEEEEEEEEMASKMWPASLLLTLLLVDIVPLVRAGIFHPTGFQPSYGLGLDYNSHPVVAPPVPPAPPVYDPAKDVCALNLDRPGHSSLFDHTQSILFGVG